MACSGPEERISYSLWEVDDLLKVGVALNFVRWMFKPIFVIAVADLKSWKARDVGLPSVPALGGLKFPCQGRVPCLRPWDILQGECCQGKTHHSREEIAKFLGSVGKGSTIF